ncbi:MAG: hypothetical protein ACTSU5_02400 [Promethearchaeota archaeon]
MEPNMAVVFVLKLACIVLDGVLASLTVNRSLHPASELAKRYYLGATSFFVIHAVCRTIFLIYNYWARDLKFLWGMGTILGLLAIVTFVWTIESTIFQSTRHGFTIFGVVGLGVFALDLFAFESNVLTEVAQAIFEPTLAVMIVSVYFLTAKRTRGEVRKSALFMVAGIASFGLGEMGNTSTAAALVPVATYFARWWCGARGRTPAGFIRSTTLF